MGVEGHLSVEAIATGADAAEASKAGAASRLHEEAYHQDMRGKDLSGKESIARGYIQGTDVSLVRLNNEFDLRQPAAREALEKLTGNDRQMLNQLESCVFQGDTMALMSLLQAVNPRGEGNLAQRAYFEHAWEVFQIDMASLGFDVSYNKSTGVFWMNNGSMDDKNAMLRSLVIDPSNERIFAVRKDPRDLSREEVTIDLRNGSAKKLYTRIRPFDQHTGSTTPDEFQSKYMSLLVDELKAGMEKLEHKGIERNIERRKEEMRRLEEATKARQAEEERRKQAELNERKP